MAFRQYLHRNLAINERDDDSKLNLSLCVYHSLAFGLEHAKFQIEDDSVHLGGRDISMFSENTYELMVKISFYKKIIYRHC